MRKKAFIWLLFVGSSVLTGIGTSINSQAVVDEVDVYGNYIPRLKPKEKFFDRPVMLDTFRITLKPTYDLEAPVLETPFSPDSIRMMKYRTPPSPKGQRFYAKLGFGNYLTPYAELRAGSLRQRQHVYDIGYQYLAGAGRIKDRGFPGMATHQICANWRFRTEQKQLLKASAEYDNQRVHYYGFRQTDYPDLSRKDYRQTYNHLKLDFGFETASPTDSSRWRVMPGLRYGFTADRFGSSENELGAEVRIQKSWGRIVMDDKIEGGFFYNNAPGAAGFASGWVGLNPAASFLLGSLRLRLGAAGYLTTQPSEVRLHAVPDVQLRWSLVGPYLEVYADAVGRVYRSSLNRLRRENPFLLTGPRLDFTRHQLAASGGFQGQVAEHFHWQAGARFDIFDRQAFFVNTPGDSTVIIPPYAGFEAVYGNLTRTTVQAVVQYLKQEKYRASLSGEYYFFHQTNPGFPGHTVPYHPLFRITARGSMQMLEKLLVRADIFYIHTQTGFERDSLGGFSTYRIKGTADINLSAEYRFNDLLSFWAGFYNMAAFAYNRWYRYPSQGFNALGGVILRF